MLSLHCFIFCHQNDSNNFKHTPSCVPPIYHLDLARFTTWQVAYQRRYSVFQYFPVSIQWENCHTYHSLPPLLGKGDLKLFSSSSQGPFFIKALQEIVFGDLESVDIFALANDKVNFISHRFVKNISNLEQLLLPSQINLRTAFCSRKGINPINVINLSHLLLQQQ